MQKKISDKPPELSAAATQKLKEYDYSGVSSNDGRVAVRVLKTILPGDADYLPKSPTWGEYVLEVKTVSSTSISYKSASLIGASGAYIPQANSSEEIQNARSVTNEVMFDTALLVGGGTALMVAGAVTGAILLGPLAYIGYLAYETNKIDGAIAYEAEFKKRVDSGTQTVDGNSTHVSSCFFPLVSNARAIVLSYSLPNGATKEIRLEMNKNRRVDNSSPKRDPGAKSKKGTNSRKGSDPNGT